MIQAQQIGFLVIDKAIVAKTTNSPKPLQIIHLHKGNMLKDNLPGGQRLTSHAPSLCWKVFNPYLLLALLTLSQKQHAVFRDMLDASPGVSWDDIAGLAEAKRVLQENVILPLYMPEYFQGIRRPVKVNSLQPCSPANNDNNSKDRSASQSQALVRRVLNLNLSANTP